MDTVYPPARRLTADSSRRRGDEAVTAVATQAPDLMTFASALGLERAGPGMFRAR